MRVFDNGSCLLHDVCTDTDHSTAASSNFPLYERLRLGADQPPLLLLRSRADHGHDPYELLINGAANDTQVDVKRVAGGRDQYKSALAAVPAPPLSHVHLVLLAADGRVAVNLTFGLAADLSVDEEGAWFGLERLAAAHPWNLTVMRAAKFGIFSMRGNENFRRRFFVRPAVGLTCTAPELAYMFLSNSRRCLYEGRDRFDYLWAEAAGLPGDFFTNAKHATELRLYGTSRAVEGRFYVRVL